MKTIEERANEYIGHPFEVDEDVSITMARDSYFRGATEQKAIDIDKACEWLKEYAMANRRTLGWGDLCVEFRKAMEE